MRDRDADMSLHPETRMQLKPKLRRAESNTTDQVEWQEMRKRSESFVATVHHRSSRLRALLSFQFIMTGGAAG